MQHNDSQVGMDLRNSNAGHPSQNRRRRTGQLVAAATLDALIVGVLWLDRSRTHPRSLGSVLGDLGGLLQIIPTFGGMIALIGPVLSVPFSGRRRCGASALSSASTA